MRLKIINNHSGLVHRTKVINVETGEELEGVTYISYTTKAGDGTAETVIALHNVEIEAETEVYKSK